METYPCGCGGVPELLNAEGKFKLACMSCGLQTMEYTDRDITIHWWNKANPIIICNMTTKGIFNVIKRFKDDPEFAAKEIYRRVNKKQNA